MTNTEFQDKENWMDEMARRTIKRDTEVLKKKNSFLNKIKKYWEKRKNEPTR